MEWAKAILPWVSCAILLATIVLCLIIARIPARLQDHQMNVYSLLDAMWLRV